jgi:hypothetical protein
MVTDTAGSNGTASSNVLRYDYLPFGGELLASTNCVYRKFHPYSKKVCGELYVSGSAKGILARVPDAISVR